MKDAFFARLGAEGRCQRLEISLDAKLSWITGDFARKYSEKEVEALLRPNDSGFRFTWSHVSCLVGLDAKKRDKLQKQCLKEKWPAEQLRERIRSELGKRSRGGPKHKEADEAFTQLVRETDAWLLHYQRIWFKETERPRPCHVTRVQKSSEKLLSINGGNYCPSVPSPCIEHTSTGGGGRG